VDGADDIWTCDRQQVVIALQVMLMFFETFSPVIGFFQFIALNHGTHRPIYDEDAGLELFNYIHKNKWSLVIGH